MILWMDGEKTLGMEVVRRWILEMGGTEGMRSRQSLGFARMQSLTIHVCVYCGRDTCCPNIFPRNLPSGGSLY